MFASPRGNDCYDYVRAISRVIVASEARVGTSYPLVESEALVHGNVRERLATSV